MDKTTGWGTKIGDPASPKKFDLKLDVIKEGWDWINGAENSAADKAAKANVARDIKLYGRWTRNAYTINWDNNQYNGGAADPINGSSVPTPVNPRITETVYYGLPLNIKKDGSARPDRPVTSRDGYTFKGWSIESGLKTAKIYDLAGGEAFKPVGAVPGPTPTPTPVVNMYAIWEPKLYTIKINFKSDDARYRRQAIDNSYVNAVRHNSDVETMIR